MDPLFPEVPEDLSALSDEDLGNLLAEHEVAAELIDSDNEDFIKGLGADDVIAAYDAGVEAIERIVGEQKARSDAQDAYAAEKNARRARRLELVGKSDEEPSEDDDSGDDDEEEDDGAVVAEAEEITAEAAEETQAEATEE